MGVEKGVVKGRIPEKHLFGHCRNYKSAQINLGRGATPKLGNARNKGYLFLGIRSLILHEHCCSLLIEQSSKSSLNIWVGKLHRMVGPTQNLV